MRRLLLTSIIAVLLAGAAAGRSLEAQGPRAALDRLHGLTRDSIVGSSTVYFPMAAVLAELESIARHCAHLPRVTSPRPLPNDKGPLPDASPAAGPAALAWPHPGRDYVHRR